MPFYKNSQPPFVNWLRFFPRKNTQQLSGERVYFSSQLKVQSVTAEKSGQQELGAARCTTSGIGKHQGPRSVRLLESSVLPKKKVERVFRPKSSQLASADASAAPPVCSESSPVLEWHWACVVPDTSCCFWPCYSVSVLPHLPLTPSLATSRIQIVAVHSPSALCKVLLTLPSFAVLCSSLCCLPFSSLLVHISRMKHFDVCVHGIVTITQVSCTSVDSSSLLYQVWGLII